MIVSVQASDVRIGMYVDSFEGSWLSHPFWRSHFVLTSQKDVERIVETGVAVRIDTSKGSGVLPGTIAQTAPRPQATLQVPTKQRFAIICRKNTKISQFGRADKACAVELARRSEFVVKTMFEECRLGGNISMPTLLAVVDEISEALEHDSSTFIAVTRLKAKDDYTYTHSVSVCALMISMARQVGYDRNQARDIGMAGLLHDLGKLRIPDEVLKKPGSLTPEETTEMRRHPVLGHEMLLKSQGVPQVVLDVCLHHHERLDGSGYPFGLKGEEIGEAVRIGSICDVYDAMTSTRPYKKGLSPAEAIELLAADAGHFDSKLLFQLMVSLGVYRPSTLVRLRSNRLAVALPLKGKSPRTVFRAFYSTVDTEFVPFEDVVPGDSMAEDRPVRSEDPAMWFAVGWSEMAGRIMRGLPALPRKGSVSPSGNGHHIQL